MRLSPIYQAVILACSLSSVPAMGAVYSGTYGTLTLTNASNDTVTDSSVDTINVTSSVGLGHTVINSVVTDLYATGGDVTVNNGTVDNTSITSGAGVSAGVGTQLTNVSMLQSGDLYMDGGAHADTITMTQNVGMSGVTLSIYDATVDSVTTSGRASVYINADSHITTANIGEGGSFYLNYALPDLNATADNVTINSTTGVLTLSNNAYVKNLNVINNNQQQNYNHISNTAHIDNLTVSRDAHIFFDGDSPSTYGSMLGGATGSTAITFQPFNGVTLQNVGIYDTAASGRMGTYKNEDGDDVYYLNDGYLASATDSTQTLYALAGDGGNYHYRISEFDDGYLDANTSSGTTYDFIARNQNLINVNRDATLVNVQGDHYVLHNTVAHNGVDDGGMKFTGNSNLFNLDNYAYAGFVEASGNNNHIFTRQFAGLSRAISSGTGNTIAFNTLAGGTGIGTFIHHRDYIGAPESNFATEGNVAGTVGHWDRIGIDGNDDILFADYVLDNDQYINGDIVGRETSQMYWIDENTKGNYTLFDANDVHFGNMVLRLNRSDITGLGTTYTSTVKDTALIQGNLEAYNAVVDMGDGMNTALHITGSVTGNLLVDKVSVDIDALQGDVVRIDGDIEGDLVLNMTESIGNGAANTEMALIQAANNVIDGNESVSLWLEDGVGSVNGDGTYTLGTSPYAWRLEGRSLDGYYLTNMVNGGVILNPEVSVLLTNPVAATYFMGPNVSNGIHNYVHGQSNAISHANDWWGQFSSDRQDQTLLTNLSYRSSIKGFDIGRDVVQGDQGYWGAAISYRGMATNIQSAVADVNTANTETSGLLASIYGVYQNGPHQWDAQGYIGRVWGTTNIQGQNQLSDSGIAYGGYGQYSYTIDGDTLHYTPYVGVNYHGSDWGDNGVTNGQSDVMNAYIGVDLKGAWGDGYEWTVGPRYTRTLSSSDIKVTGVSQSLEAKLPQDVWGMSMGVSRHWKGGSWYVRWDQSKTKGGDGSKWTVGGTMSF